MLSQLTRFAEGHLARTLWRWRAPMALRHQRKAAVRILMYHGLVPGPMRVPDWCFVTAEAFEAQMRYLAEHYTVIPAEAALEPFSAGGKPRVVITFDDGFSSVHHLALPVLRRLGIPATVYMATSYLDSDDTVWFAKVHGALEQSARTEVLHEGFRLRLQTPSDRQRASRLLQGFLKGMPPLALSQSVRQLLDALDVDADRPVAMDSPYRMLSGAQIREMAAWGLMSFGGHTESHHILAHLSDVDLEREIGGSVARIRSISGLPCTTFAYPNGRLGDIDQRVDAALVKADISIAMTTEEGPNFAGTPAFQLRRYGVGYWDGVRGLRNHLNDFRLAKFTAF